MVCSLNLLQVAESESGSCSDRDSIRSEARCWKGIEPASNSAGWGCACQCPGFFYLRSFRAQVV